MHRYFCTYFDCNYLLKALALMASMKRYFKDDFTLFAVCLDETTHTLLQNISPPNVVPIPLHKIEQHDEALLSVKEHRSPVEYYWTLTPNVLLWVLDHYPQIELITYLDADLYFFADCQPVFDELGDDSVLIHEHRFSEQLRHLEKYGKYNVGWVTIRRDLHGLEVLRWWRERCIEWCYDFLDSGRYGDQLYLDDWTERFKKVHVLQHIGAGVAPFNHIQYRFWRDETGTTRVDDRPLIFYHFHSLYFVRPGIVVPAKYLHYPLREDILRCCFIPYIEEVLHLAKVVQKIAPGFSFGLFKDDLLSVEYTVIAEKTCRDEVQDKGFTEPAIDLSAGWECHCSPQMNPPLPPL